MGNSGVSWTNYKSFALRSKQAVTPTPRHSTVTLQRSFCAPTTDVKGLNNYMVYACTRPLYRHLGVRDNGLIIPCTGKCWYRSASAL